MELTKEGGGMNQTKGFKSQEATEHGSSKAGMSSDTSDS
jgi:hypothetical protein